MQITNNALRYWAATLWLLATFAIGQVSSIDGSPMPPNSPQYVLAHAILGCAASAAEGTGCASGAIGEASSAFLSYNVVNAIDPTGAPLDQGQIAAVTALAMLAGGGVAGLLGQNATVAATWAENEALNNATSTKKPKICCEDVGIRLQPVWGHATCAQASERFGARRQRYFPQQWGC